MRVLVCHNRYRSDAPSGENQAVADEIAALERDGFDVQPLTPSSDDLAWSSPGKLIQAAGGPLYSRSAVRAVENLLQHFKPDVVHVHNVYPMLSPAIVSTVRSAGVPVVQTLHNYRHDCVNGLHFRDGGNCIDCVGRAIPWPALAHACYRGSRLQTMPMAASQVLHRSTWRQVSHFIVLTAFMTGQLERLGVDKQRITIRPTPALDPGPSPSPSRRLLFAGRFDPTKGCDLLLEAWTAAGLSTRGWDLLVAGGGEPDLATRQPWAEDPSVTFAGSLEPGKMTAAFRGAGLVTIPSRVFEGYPRVFSEACAHGRGLLISAGGSLGTLADDAYAHAAPATVRGWTHALEQVPTMDLTAMGIAARAAWKAAMSPDASIASLRTVYERAVRMP